MSLGLASRLLAASTFAQKDALAGTQLHLLPCDAGAWNFEWSTPAAGSGVQLAVKNYAGACVDCDGCVDGHEPHIWDCDATNTNQLYETVAITGSGSNVQLKNLRPDIQPPTCIASTTDATAALEMRTCDATSNLQAWSWNAAAGTLTSAAHAGMCIALTGIPCTVQRTLSQGNFSKIDAWCNPLLPPKQRAKALVAVLHTDEKIRQLSTGPNGMGVNRLGVPGARFGEALHGVASDCGSPAPNQPDGSNSSGCPTSFSHGMALGSTFNRSLWTIVADTIGTEARAMANQGKAGHVFWAPDINLARDPRWGRGQEVPGEDPFLNSEYIMRYATAFQFGADYDETTGMPTSERRRPVLSQARFGHYGSRRNIATAKHFMDYDCEVCAPCNVTQKGDPTDGAQCSRQNFNALVSDRDQVEYYWPAFRAAIQGGDVGSIMCSYNGVNGIPSCANEMSQNEVLRSEWGFDGFIVSDCGAIVEPMFTHYVNVTLKKNLSAQVLIGLTGGCDMGCGNFYGAHAQRAVDDGTVSLDIIDTAVTRAYTKLIENGLLDDDISPYNSLSAMDVDTPRSRQIALEASQQAMVLLKNEGGLLPLSEDSTIALIGPHFNSTEQMLSIYYGGNSLAWSHSPFDALYKRVGIKGKIVGHHEGCGVLPVPTPPPSPGPVPTMNPTVDPKQKGGYGDVDTTECNDKSGFSDAAALAKKADIAIVFIGLHPHEYVLNNTGANREDEGEDRPYTKLPGFQSELVQAVMAANPKTVVVLIHGSSMSIDWTAAHVPAILDAHYPGEVGGDAITGVLYGDVAPSGRVTQTIYPAAWADTRSISDMSMRGYDGKSGITYMHYTGPTLYKFGFGLSYTTFSFTWSTASGDGAVATTTATMAGLHKRHYTMSDVDRATLTPGYTIVVKNTGSVAGATSVLAFLDSTQALGGDVDAPANGELIDFGRTAVLAPGASETIRLTIAPTVLSLVNEFGTERISPGIYRVTIGVQGSAEDVSATGAGLLQGSLKLSGDAIEVFSLADAKARANEKTHGLWGADPY